VRTGRQRRTIINYRAGPPHSKTLELNMAFARKLVLNCRNGYDARLNAMVEEFIKDGVVFVGVVGKDCAKVEGIVDELVVGDGSRKYDLLTASHTGESLQQAINFAKSLTGEFVGDVQVVEL